MTHRLLIAACISLNLFSCKKTDPLIPATADGRWELIRTQGQITIDYPQNQGNLLILSGNQYQSFLHDSLTGHGIYALVNINNASAELCIGLPDKQFPHQIIFNNNTDSIKTYIDYSEHVLRLGSGCFADDSGVISTYTNITKAIP